MHFIQVNAPALEQAVLLRETAVEVRFLPVAAVQERSLVCVWSVRLADRRVVKGGVLTPPHNDKILLLFREQVQGPLTGV